MHPDSSAFKRKRNLNLRLKFKMESRLSVFVCQINEFRVRASKKVCEAKEAGNLVFFFRRRIFPSGQARAKRIVSFLPNVKQKRAAFLRRVNGTLCAGYSCHSRVRTSFRTFTLLIHTGKEI